MNYGRIPVTGKLSLQGWNAYFTLKDGAVWDQEYFTNLDVKEKCDYIDEGYIVDHNLLTEHFEIDLITFHNIFILPKKSPDLVGDMPGGLLCHIYVSGKLHRWDALSASWSVESVRTTPMCSFLIRTKYSKNDESN